MFEFIRRAFRDLGRPVSPATTTGPVTPEPPGDDDDVLIGVRGSTPVYLGAAKNVIAQLRPVYTRSARHSRPHPREQPAIGLKADADFQPPRGPLGRPRGEVRGIAAIENNPPSGRPYSLAGDELSGCPADHALAPSHERAPYSLTGRDLSG